MMRFQLHLQHFKRVLCLPEWVGCDNQNNKKKKKHVPLLQLFFCMHKTPIKGSNMEIQSPFVVKKNSSSYFSKTWTRNMFYFLLGLIMYQTKFFTRDSFSTEFFLQPSTFDLRVANPETQEQHKIMGYVYGKWQNGQESFVRSYQVTNA